MNTQAIIYTRVSSKRQVEEGHGLDTQEKRCRDYAKSMGYEVLAVFREEGESGGLFERTAMKQVLAFLEKNDSNNINDQIVVIFDDLKRFARDVEIHFRLKKEVYGRNGRIESPNFKFEDTPEGKFVETMMAAHAELERNQNKRQVKQKMKARLELGYWPFMPPLGLINTKDAVHGKILVSNEPYASVMKTAIEKYRDGLLLTQEEVRQCLHDEFEKAGLPNRPAMSTTQEILSNPLYAGYIEYEDWGISFMKAKHDGFISIETFNIVQKRLQSRTKPWKRIDYSVDFPLRPHVLCDVCGKPMTASWNKGRSERYPNYFCRNSECMYRWRVIRKKIFEDQFEEHLAGVKPTDENIDLAKAVFNERWNLFLEKHDAQRSKLITQAKEANDDIEWYVKRARKTRDEELVTTYEETIKSLRKKLKETEQGLNGQLYTSEQFGTASDRVLNTLKNPMSMWKSDEYNDKRTILYMYFEGQLRYNYETGFGTTALACPINVINQIGQAKNASVEMSGNEPESEKYCIKTSTSVADV